MALKVGQAEERKTVAWGALCSRIGFAVPLGVTEADIHAAAERLGITLPLPAPTKP